MTPDRLTSETVAKVPAAPESAHDAVGLTDAEAARRLAQIGENALADTHVSALAKLLSYFWGPIPRMIEIAALLSAAVQHWADFAIIVVMLPLNAGVGFWQEFKADSAIAALKQRLALKARVLRDGRWREVPARELVPEDVVLIRLGNIVPADVRLVGSGYLSVDQSAPTGESLPVDKKAGDAAYSGSVAKLGEMKAVVTSTGMNTYFGRTARLVQGASTVSHFQRAVLRIGNFLIFCTIGLVALILVVALYRGDPLVEMLLFALILTVAAIPVALPAVLSVTMAVGAEHLARLKAIVSRLVAIEELAGLDVLCADKTGTLTQNKLTLGEPVLFEATNAQDLLLAAALASRREGADAIDQAILEAFGSGEPWAGYTITEFQLDPVSKRAEATVGHDGVSVRVNQGRAPGHPRTGQARRRARRAGSCRDRRPCGERLPHVGRRAAGRRGRLALSRSVAAFRSAARGRCRYDQAGAAHGRRYQDGHRRSLGDRPRDRGDASARPEYPRRRPGLRQDR